MKKPFYLVTFLRGLCLNIRIQATISTTRAAEAEYRLKFKPPLAKGLSRKSPTTAPNGLVRINAAKNKAVREIAVK